MKSQARTLAFETLPALALAAAALWDAYRLGTRYATTIGAYEGAAWMTLIAILLIATIVAILLHPPTFLQKAGDDNSGSARPTAIVALIGAYIFGLNYLGFIISTVPFLLVYMVLLSERKLLSSLIISVLFTLAAAYVFDLLLVPLPDGLFF